VRGPGFQLGLDFMAMSGLVPGCRMGSVLELRFGCDLMPEPSFVSDFVLMPKPGCRMGSVLELRFGCDLMLELSFVSDFVSRLGPVIQRLLDDRCMRIILDIG
jgi:hypothetical protein